MALEGDIKLPGVGPVSKKMALYVGGGLGALVILMVVRKRKAAAAANAGVPSSDIDPATGFAYGSAEDQAALASQGGSIAAVPGGTGGGSSGPVSVPGTGFRTNAEWSQAVISYMASSGAVNDPQLISQALGLYLNGRPAGDFRQLIEQAIAVEGLPPVAGPAGFPPAINETPAATPASPPPTTQSPPPTAPNTAFAPAGTYLYDWASSQGITGTKLAQLNPQQWANRSIVYFPGIRGSDGNLIAVAKSGATWKLS